MTTYAFRRAHGRARAAVLPTTHLVWLLAGAAGAFLVPFVLADRLGLPRNLYLALYAGYAFGLFAAWARATGQSLPAMIRRRWVLATALGLGCGGVLALVVLRDGASSSRPGGLELAGALLWRGVVYGLADGLLLSAFPILVVFAAFGARRHGLRLVGVGAAALAASIAMTAVYHLGYGDFRSAKVRKPIAGDLVWSVPTLVTLNPIGAPIAHAGLHVTAVLDDYRTDVYLPPHG